VLARAIAICGPTAAGKSGLALTLARQLGGEIVSADSRQVYREFDIGTAKPTLAERDSVPHYLIDICKPTETLTVADYQQRAREAIAQIFAAGKMPIIVGGSGLYLRAVIKGMKIPPVAPQPKLREQLAALGQWQCYQLLQQVDPPAAAGIHFRDPVRTLRALEVYYVTGDRISRQQGENPPPYPILQIGIDCSRDRLASRIARRMEEMLARGWVEEVEFLQGKYGADLPLLKTLGYGEIQQYLAGKVSLEEVKELIARHTRQFAKKQRTWFRGVEGIEWFDSEGENLVELVLAKSLLWRGF